MVDDRKVVGNTLAFGAAMAYDRIAGAIGPLELSEYLGLAAGRLETTNMRRQRVTSNDQRKHGQTRGERGDLRVRPARDTDGRPRDRAGPARPRGGARGGLGRIR
jgi:hypothetical protein